MCMQVMHETFMDLWHIDRSQRVRMKDGVGKLVDEDERACWEGWEILLKRERDLVEKGEGSCCRG